MAEGELRGGGVDPQLHPQGPALLELLAELLLREEGRHPPLQLRHLPLKLHLHHTFTTEATVSPGSRSINFTP
jgi:hypothetical protein